MARFGLTVAGGLLLFVPICSRADPAPLTEPLFPAITSTGLAVSVSPLLSFPADNDAAANGATARIQYVVANPDNANQLFINDTNGILYTASASGGTPTPYLNLNTQNVGFLDLAEDDGFSGVAFNPNFDGDPTKPGYGVFYTLYSATNTGQPLTYEGNDAGNHVTVLREWTATDPNAPTFSGTSRVVMTIGDSTAGYNGGMIAFNPTAQPGSADYGNLYIAMGDAGFNDPEQNGQNLSNPRGKILRIDPALGPQGQPFTIPSDNPFVSTPGANPTIWAYGLRNPQSFSWDSVTGQMYINDIGQAQVEEVDVGAAGANYGWPLRQGTVATVYGVGLTNPNDQNAYAPLQSAASLGLTDPIAEYDHTEGFAIGSGFVYNGSAIPYLDGMYIMADIVNGDLFYFDPKSVAPGQQATLHELLVTENGAPVNLLDLYGYDDPYLEDPRLDMRLSELPDGELVAALKGVGEVLSIGPSASVDVPEPSALAALCAAVLGLVPFRRRRARADGQAGEGPGS